MKMDAALPPAEFGVCLWPLSFHQPPEAFIEYSSLYLESFCSWSFKFCRTKELHKKKHTRTQKQVCFDPFSDWVIQSGPLFHP